MFLGTSGVTACERGTLQTVCVGGPCTRELLCGLGKVGGTECRACSLDTDTSGYGLWRRQHLLQMSALAETRERFELKPCSSAFDTLDGQ